MNRFAIASMPKRSTASSRLRSPSSAMRPGSLLSDSSQATAAATPS